MEGMQVRLDAFEGPLDLLYHLIEKNEIDIYDIPISKLTDQYLAYLDAAEDRDMDGMSEFLLMAATLLEIKSKLLLPKTVPEGEEGPDPREELVRKLLEYRKIKDAAEDWKEREEKAAQVLYKEADAALTDVLRQKQEVPLQALLEGITTEQLYEAFQKVMQRKELRVDKVRSSFRQVQPDAFTVEEKMDFLRDLLRLRPKLSFFSVFRQKAGRMEMVITFLALLELMKRREVLVRQTKTFAEIEIIRNTGSETM